MKNITIRLALTTALLSSLLVFSPNLWAQKGRVMLNAGVSIGNGFVGVAPAGGYFVTKGFSIGPQYYAIKETASLAMNSAVVYEQEVTVSFIGLRGDFHVNALFPGLNERIDPYVGVTAGKILLASTSQQASGSVVKENSTYDGITLFAPVGIRYWFSRHMGAYAEYNIGVANVTADINGNGKREGFYEQRQYQVGAGLSVRF